MYWGVQPFTSGPIYFGAIICFLFVLGLYIVKGQEKWWLLVATILSLMLSWGKNLEFFNEFLFNNLPLYNKFRVPSMALVVANVTMVTMAILALKEYFVQKQSKALNKALLMAGGIVGGICLFFALFGGGIFDFTAPSDANFPDFLKTALVKDRAQMLTSDAWRSFAFIAFAFAVLWLFAKNTLKQKHAVIAIGVLILVDLWVVDKRFLNDDKFITKREARTFTATAADKQILQDKDPNYRVLNLSVNTFNDATTSYFHKSVGGYSAVKMQRYQDIIDYHFAKGLNMDVLNMLNTKYFIVPNKESGQPQVQQNPNALGNAWFVDSVKWVNSPDEEIIALYDFDPSKTAFIDKEWKEKLGGISEVETDDSTATIRLTDYVNPGYLKYESTSTKEQLAVFSEVYYKTWKAYIDGEEVPVVRVNYILRGIKVPPGTHQIKFKCMDEIYEAGKTIGIVSNILIVLTIGSLLYLILRKRKKELPKSI